MADLSRPGGRGDTPGSHSAAHLGLFTAPRDDRCGATCPGRLLEGLACRLPSAWACGYRVVYYTTMVPWYRTDGRTSIFRYSSCAQPDVRIQETLTAELRLNFFFKGGVSDPHMGISLRQCHIFDASCTEKNQYPGTGSGLEIYLELASIDISL